MASYLHRPFPPHRCSDLGLNENYNFQTNLDSLLQKKENFLGTFSFCDKLILLLQQLFEKVLPAYLTVRTAESATQNIHAVPQ